MLVADAYLGERLRKKDVQAFANLNERSELGVCGFLIRLVRAAAANLIQLVVPIGRRRYGLRRRFAPLSLGAMFGLLFNTSEGPHRQEGEVFSRLDWRASRSRYRIAGWMIGWTSRLSPLEADGYPPLRYPDDDLAEGGPSGPGGKRRKEQWLHM